MRVLVYVQSIDYLFYKSSHRCHKQKVYLHCVSFNSPFVLQVNSQRVQDIGFSTECLNRLCLFTLLLSLQEYWQYSQVNGFSPVCVLLFCFILPFFENDLVHWSQGHGFSPVWVLLCFFKLRPSENDLVHWSQQTEFFHD